MFNICMTGVPEEEESENWLEAIFEEILLY